MSEGNAQPPHLNPSELGTKEYWDNHYSLDLSSQPTENDDPPDPSDLESWFSDVNAPSKVLNYLTSPSFPPSPASNRQSAPIILDLGTGNGSMLFSLALEGGYTTSGMVGVDYSETSIALARSLWQGYAKQIAENQGEREESDVAAQIIFEVLDVIRDDVGNQSWWPKQGGVFDLVLDKGTFDAVSLSDEVVRDEEGRERRVCEVYPARVVKMVKPGGFLLVTSCNWTEEEVIRWFTRGEGVVGEFEVFDRIKYPTFEFGGRKGQGVASVCFRR